MAVDLIVFQPTSLCNLNCDYCYLPSVGRRRRQLMPLELFERASAMLLRSNLLSPSPMILWHAGEPLAAGLQFYRDAFEILARNNIYARRLRYSFQTNGTLIDDDWCRLFLDHHCEIGVSVDGPAFLNDLHRQSWNGRGSFKQVMDGVAHLRRHRIPYSAICVLTIDALSHADELYDFFASEGFQSVGFNVEEIEAAHKTSSLLQSDSPCAKHETRSLYEGFMRRLLERWKSDGGFLNIREFDNISSKIAFRSTIPNFVAAPDVTQGLKIVTVRLDGRLSTFSPELASGVADDPDKFSIGTIDDLEELEDLITDKRYQTQRRQIAVGIKKCASECGYFAICGGGCPSNKYFENGTFESSVTRNCALHVQALTDVLVEGFINTPEFAAAIAEYVSREVTSTRL
jgi:uncharacterized protein